MKASHLLALLTLTLVGCAFDPAQSDDWTTDALQCGWAPSSVLQLEALPEGQCWQVTPEGSDRATTLDGASACDAATGPHTYRGGASVRVWYAIGSRDHATGYYPEQVGCP